MFFWLVLAISVAPYLIMPTTFPGKSAPNTEMVLQAILFLANAHIAITLYLYWDRSFRSIINDNPRRYLTFPALAVAGSAISYAATPPGYVFFWWAVYIMWQNWHFGKQTFGVYALVSMDQTPGQRVSFAERTLIYLAVAAGALGALWAVGPIEAVKPYANILRDVCGYITAVLLAWALMYVLAKRMPVKRAFFLIFSVLFFTPQYFPWQESLSLIPYSVSHSFQYLFFMAVVAFNARTEGNTDFDPKLISALIFFSLVLIGGSIITIRGEFGTMVESITGSSVLGKLVTGGMFGLVVAHFIVDAHAWRLRDKPQRDFVMGRMRFIGRRQKDTEITSAEHKSTVMSVTT